MPIKRFPLLSILIASVPPSVKAMVSAAGENIPVFVSPVNVMLGADTVPAANVDTPVWLTVPVTEMPDPVTATMVDPLLWMFNKPSFPPVDFRPEVPDTTPSSEFMMLGILLSFQGRYFGF